MKNALNRPYPSGRSSTRRAWAAVALSTALIGSACGDTTGPSLPEVGAVTINLSSHEMEIGGTVQLGASVLDTMGVVMTGHTVTWSSADESVATVSSAGLVTGIASGLAVISATSEGVSGSLDLMVMAGECRLEVTSPMLVGQTFDGSLMPYDCVLLEGPFADGYEISVPQEQGIELVMESNDFDALLLITTTDFQFVAWNDDGAGGSNARLVTSLPAGTYLVWATSFGESSTGDYRLTSETVELVSCDVPVGAITPGQTVSGNLAFRGCTRFGVMADPWTFTVSQEAHLQIDLTSPDFDTVLEISEQSGQTVAWDDDGGAGMNSRVIGTFEGTYTAWVTSFAGMGGGAYQLSVTTAAGLSMTRSIIDLGDPVITALSFSDVLAGNKSVEHRGKR